MSVSEINQRLKEVRQALNMSQAKFAKALSMSNGYVAQVELGNTKVNDRIIKLMHFILNVNEDWLRSGKGDMFEEEPNTTLALAVSSFKELKPIYQEYVLKQIDQLLEIQSKEDSEA